MPPTRCLLMISAAASAIPLAVSRFVRVHEDMANCPLFGMRMRKPGPMGEHWLAKRRSFGFHPPRAESAPGLVVDGGANVCPAGLPGSTEPCTRGRGWRSGLPQLSLGNSDGAAPA